MMLMGRVGNCAALAAAAAKQLSAVSYQLSAKAKPAVGCRPWANGEIGKGPSGF